MSRQPPFRQAETVQLAPDALVFINGSDTIRDDNNNVYEIRNDITEISTSLSTESTPGTASFTVVVPDHSIRRSANTRYNSIKIMSEVEFYLKGRFTKENTKTQTEEYPYYPVFWGVIISIVENYSDGMHTIQISCADILRWWQITTVNINPAVIATSTGVPDVANPEAYQLNANAFGNTYAQLTTVEILLELSKISVENLMPVQNAIDPSIGTTDKIDSSLREAVANNEELMRYWQQRFGQIGRSLRIFGIKNVQLVDGKYTFEYDEESYLNVKPYPLEARAPNAFDSELKSKLEIANEIKDILQFEFYMDVNGEIIFKPAFYNMNVIKNRVSVVRDLDIISWNFNQNEAEVITRADCTGGLNEQIKTGVDEIARRGVWIDFNLAKRFGIRATTRHVQWITDKKELMKYAQAEMAKANALARQGSITIAGRPELRLGYPIYIPSRDAFYYIKSIDHSFSFGGSFQTTLSLVAERRKLTDDNGNPLNWGIFRNVGEVSDTPSNESGTSQVDKLNKDTNPASYNPYKFMTQLCAPSKRSNPVLTQPNFAKTFEHLEYSTFGNWQRFNNIVLGNDVDVTREYQISDGEGYELVTPFKYGRDYNFSDTSTIEQSSGQTTNKIESKAQQAQWLNPEQFKLVIDPNNTSLTLDNENSSMLYLFDRTSKTKGEKAMNVNPERSGK